MDPQAHQGYGPDQMFCLRWSNHQTNMLNVFNQLRYNESFVDVTLAVDGRVLKAHKMVLSACSPYFQKMFEMTPDKHPVVFIDRVHYQDMKRLLEFMYRGEVSIDQETLNRFLKVARSLRIRGLTEIEEPGGGGGSTLSPSAGPLDELARHRLAEQMAAAALAECHQHATEPAAAPAAVRRPASCSPDDEAPRKALRRDSEPRSRSEQGLGPGSEQGLGPGPGPGLVPGPGPGPDPDPEREAQPGAAAGQPLGAGAAAAAGTPLDGDQWSETEALNHSASVGGCGGGASITVTKKEVDSERGTSAEQSPPLVPKNERADVFCQPDFWISEGIYVAGQNPPASVASQAGSRDAMSPPPAGLDDTPLSPDDPASLLDYITHEDGSVTCKLCGEQVPSRNHWYRHKYRMHAWHTYKCDDCGITYKSKRGFEAHLEAKHERPTERTEHEPARRRDWEGVARALEDTRKKKEEELVSDIINRVKRECAMEGEDYTRRGYVKHF